MAEMEVGPKTYGNWVRPSRSGLNSLSGAATAVLFVVLVIAVVVNMLFGLVACVVVSAVSGGCLWLLVTKDRHNVTLAQKIGENMVFRRARASGATVYRSGVAGVAGSGSCRLPGLLSASRLGEFRDSWDRPFVVVQMPQVGTCAVVFACQPDGAALVDQDQIDVWVGRWGHWLANLGQEVDIVGAQAVIETAPDSGTRLRQELEANVSAEAPELARRVMGEVQDLYPAGQARVSAWLTITYRAQKMTEFGADMARRVPGLTASLAGTGAGVVRPLTAAEVRRVVREAFDPVSGEVFDAAELAGQQADVAWEECGPSGADELRDCYVHDSAASMTWMMSQAPTGQVQSSLLARLLAPQAEIARKRVALMYRPIDIARAVDIVESDVNVARSRLENMRRPTSRALTQLRKASKSAEEEAAGAGLENFGVLITATARDVDELAGVRAVVERLAPATRIQIRPVYGGQAAGFAASLPLGVVPLLHSRVSESVRTAL